MPKNEGNTKQNNLLNTKIEAKQGETRAKKTGRPGNYKNLRRSKLKLENGDPN